MKYRKYQILTNLLSHPLSAAIVFVDPILLVMICLSRCFGDFHVIELRIIGASGEMRDGLDGELIRRSETGSCFLLCLISTTDGTDGAKNLESV